MAKKIFTRTIYRDVLRPDGEVLSVERQIDVVALRKGQILFVRGIVGPTVDTDELSEEITELNDGHKLVRFRKNVIVAVEGLHPNLMTCHHLRFARLNQVESRRYKNRGDVDSDTGRKRQLFHNRITRFIGRRHLLAALLQKDYRPIYIPGGLRYAIARCPDENGLGGETIIPAPKRGVKYKEDGEIPSGFIIQTNEIDSLLDSLSSR